MVSYREAGVCNFEIQKLRMMTTFALKTGLPRTPAENAPPISEDRLAWLALALSPGLGPKRILDALQQLDAPA
jgi:hypothetical protein